VVKWQLWQAIKHKFTRRPRPVGLLAGYALWAAAYPPESHNPLMAAEQGAMLDLLPEVRGKVCLDLAGGSGRYGHLLQARGAGRVVGVDYSAAMLARSLRFGGGLARAIFLALPFAAASFDVVVCGLAVGHEPKLSGLLAEAGRVLRPGGVLLYSDIHPFGVLAGWQRTFTAANGAVYALPHHLHLPGDHLQACRAAGLTLTAMAEPRAGKSAPPEYGRFPLALVIRAQKDANGK
jgi:malonyl-CoA O-methyltransferase